MKMMMKMRRGVFNVLYLVFVIDRERDLLGFFGGIEDFKYVMIPR